MRGWGAYGTLNKLAALSGLVGAGLAKVPRATHWYGDFTVAYESL